MQKSNVHLTDLGGLKVKGAGLSRGNLLFRRLYCAVQETRGNSLTYDALSELIDEPKSTFSRWLHGEAQPSSEALLRLLELTSDELRREIMEKPPFRRMYPRLEHPWLAHDPAAISHLRTILSNPNGLTIVRGDQESSVTFVVTAIGHAAAIAEPGRSIMGLDLHAPDWFVPVHGVVYLHNELHPDLIRRELDRFWPGAAASRGSLVILNGTLPLAALSTQASRSVVAHAHVVLAERTAAKSSPGPVPSPAYVITVSSPRAHGDRLAIQIERA